jgi:hypothetical protein
MENSAASSEQRSPSHGRWWGSRPHPSPFARDRCFQETSGRGFQETAVSSSTEICQETGMHPKRRTAIRRNLQVGNQSCRQRPHRAIYRALALSQIRRSLGAKELEPAHLRRDKESFRRERLLRFRL